MKPPPSELVAALREEIEGEVRFDDVSRILYSTDASLYQLLRRRGLLAEVPRKQA